MLSPLIETMKTEGVPLPNSFNARTKCVPEWDEVVEGLTENLGEVEEKIRRACKCERGGERGKESVQVVGFQGAACLPTI